LSAVAEELRKKRNDILNKDRALKDQYKSLCEKEQSLNQSKPVVTKAAQKEAESSLQDSNTHTAVLRTHSALKPSQIDRKLINTPSMISNLKKKKLRSHSLSATHLPVPATAPTPNATAATAPTPIASPKAAPSAKAPKQPQLPNPASGNLKSSGLEDDNEPPRRKDPPELLLNQLNQSEYSVHVLSLFLHTHT
jgi:hypothetical protein